MPFLRLVNFVLQSIIHASKVVEEYYIKSGYLKVNPQKYQSKVRTQGGRKVRMHHKAVKLSRRLDKLRIVATACLEGGKGQCCRKKCLQEFSPKDLLQAMTNYQVQTFPQRKTFVAATARECHAHGKVSFMGKEVCKAAHAMIYGYSRRLFHEAYRAVATGQDPCDIDFRSFSSLRWYGKTKDMMMQLLGDYIRRGNVCFDPGRGDACHKDRVSKFTSRKFQISLRVVNFVFSDTPNLVCSAGLHIMWIQKGCVQRHQG